ncbi:hypothetical protein Tco_0294765 [Tanacetum coccineum]
MRRLSGQMKILFLLGSVEMKYDQKEVMKKELIPLKSEVIKRKKEEVQEESKEEESTRKRKLGTRKKMKSRKRRFIQNTSEDDSEKENDELRLHLTIAPMRKGIKEGYKADIRANQYLLKGIPKGHLLTSITIMTLKTFGKREDDSGRFDLQRMKGIFRFTMNLKHSVKSKVKPFKDTTLGAWLREQNYDGKEREVVVQDVRGRYNANNQRRPFQRNNARGNGVAGNVGGQNIGGIVNPSKAKPSCVNMTIMQAQESGAVLVKNSVDVSLQGTGYNVVIMWMIPPEDDFGTQCGHVFEADECDAIRL